MSIRLRLVLLAVLIAVPAVVVAAWTALSTYQRERQSVEQTLRETAHALALVVDRELARREAVVEILASSPSLAEGDLEAFDQQVRRAVRGTNEWIMLLDENDRFIHTRLPEGEAPVPYERPPLLPFITSGTQVSNLFIGSTIREPVLTVYTAVGPRGNGGARFNLHLSFRPEALDQILEQQHFPRGWIAAIFDRNAVAVARRPDSLRWVGHPATPDLAARIRTESSGFLRSRSLEGIEATAFFSKSPRYGWTFVIGVPESVLGRSAVRSAIEVGLGSGALTLLALAGAVLVGRSISRPVLRLRQSAREFEETGGFAFAPTGVPEIDAVGTTLERAAERVGQANRVLEQARAQAEAASRAKDEFLAILAHELRNPLAPIRNAVQIMRVADHDRAALADARNMIERQLQQLVRLIDDLLDVSRITRGKVDLRRERLAVAQVVQLAVETSRPAIAARRHHLRIELPEEPLYVHADLTRLAQVLANLLNNSARYTPAEGEIAVTARGEGEQVAITVADSGIGIPPEMLPHVFDLFTQAHAESTGGQEGLGIGLTLARRLVELHGGTIEARSAGTGSGAQFIVRLPRLSPGTMQPAPEPAAQAVAPASQAAAARRILVVDDNRDGAASLALMLELEGHELRMAFGGREALEAAEQFRPEVVLLDIGMPDLDGYAVARELRSRAWASRIVLIALTGWGQEQDRQRSREAGFDHHLTKPVEPAVLNALIRSLHAPASGPSAAVLGTDP